MEVRVENDVGVEQAGATDTVAYMKAHWESLLRASKLEEECSLSDQDDHLYKLFRSNFAFLDIVELPEDSIHGQRWRDVLMGLESRVKDYNMMTLLRRYVHLSYEDPAQELKVVPRAAFILVEVARNKEGCYQGFQVRILARQVELGLSDLLSAAEGQEPGALREALSTLSSLNRGCLPRALLKRLDAGKILRHVHHHVKVEAAKGAVVKLWGQWKYGFELERIGDIHASHFGELRSRVVTDINSLGGKKVLPRSRSRSTKVCGVKIDLERFPLYWTKRSLLIACGSCAHEEILETERFACLSISEGSVLQSFRILLLTYEDAQTLPFGSLHSHMRGEDAVEYRVQRFLHRAAASVPSLARYVTDVNDKNEPDTEEDICVKFFEEGLSVITLNDLPTDLTSTTCARHDGEALERTMFVGVEDICKNKPKMSKNECYIAFFKELRRGEATKSVLDAAQEEAYIAETDIAQHCLKELPEMEQTNLSCVVNAGNLELIKTDGFAIMDDFLDPQLLKSARADMEALSGQLEFNAQSLSELRRRDDSVTHVSAEDLVKMGFVHLARVLQKLRAVPGLLQALVEDTLFVPKKVMLASYCGSGARHQSHRDNYPMKGDEGDNGRVLTALLYMNPEWTANMGGQLRLQLNVPLERTIDMKQFDPWHTTESKADFGDAVEHIDVDPLGGRLVVFKSREIVHSVLPLSETAGNRMALTLWVTDKEQEASFTFKKLSF